MAQLLQVLWDKFNGKQANDQTTDQVKAPLQYSNHLNTVRYGCLLFKW